MLILKYLPDNRKRSQRDENNNRLTDFHGPVELWETCSGLYQVRLYIGTNEAQHLNSCPKDYREEAYELFNNACKLISNLPEDHPLNHFLSPQSPASPPEPPLEFVLRCVS